MVQPTGQLLEPVEPGLREFPLVRRLMQSWEVAARALRESPLVQPTGQSSELAAPALRVLQVQRAGQAPPPAAAPIRSTGD